MNALLSLIFEPAWLGYVSLGLGPAAFVFSGFAYFKLDNRYVRKDTAEEMATLIAKERQSEVEQLRAADARIELKLEEVAATVRQRDEAAQTAIASLRTEMSTGFLALTKTISEGVLSLTKEVALIQGRLAGANGVVKQDGG